MPIPRRDQEAALLHGFMRGTVEIAPDVDLTAPTSDVAEFETAR